MQSIGVMGKQENVCGTGIHPIAGTEIFHTGIDIGASQENPIYAYANDIVTRYGQKTNWSSGINWS